MGGDGPRRGRKEVAVEIELDHQIGDPPAPESVVDAGQFQQQRVRDLVALPEVLLDRPLVGEFAGDDLAVGVQFLNEDRLAVDPNRADAADRAVAKGHHQDQLAVLVDGLEMGQGPGYQGLAEKSAVGRDRLADGGRDALASGRERVQIRRAGLSRVRHQGRGDQGGAERDGGADDRRRHHRRRRGADEPGHEKLETRHPILQARGTAPAVRHGPRARRRQPRLAETMRRPRPPRSTIASEAPASWSTTARSPRPASAGSVPGRP